MKFLLLGAGGQLGNAFQELFLQNSLNFQAFTYADIDISHFLTLESILSREKPDVLVNCAAYNQVDFAEVFPPKAYAVNAYGVRNLAILCERMRIKLVHFSSDYVFDGSLGRKYREQDVPVPLNVYGRSKLLGENFLQEISSNFLLFRTSWIYGIGKQNFIYKLQAWAKSSDSVSVSCDEISVPTSARLIADITMKALEKNLEGLYHLTCSGSASRFDFAKEVFKCLDIKKKLIPISKTAFNLRARRGDFLVLDNSLLKKSFELPHWREELERFIL